MTLYNPFSMPHAELTPSLGGVRVGDSQPLQFIAAMVIASALVFVGSTAWQWFSDLSGYRDRLAQYLPMMLANWVGGLIFHAAAVLLLVHEQRERHGIVRFRPAAGLLAGFGLLYLLATLIVSTAMPYLSVRFYPWAFGQEARTFWMILYSQFTGLVGLALGCLLPLWLVLRLARPRAERLAPGQAAVPSRQVALGVALCFVALIYKVLASLSYAAYLYSGADGWQPVLLLSGCLLPFAIAMAAVQTRLPARVSRFAAGRVLAASLVLLALWAAAILLVSIVAAFAVYGSLNSSGLPFYLLLPAALLLALLWPLARWCTGWFFGEMLKHSD